MTARTSKAAAGEAHNRPATNKPNQAPVPVPPGNSGPDTTAKPSPALVGQLAAHVIPVTPGIQPIPRKSVYPQSSGSKRIGNPTALETTPFPACDERVDSRRCSVSTNEEVNQRPLTSSSTQASTVSSQATGTESPATPIINSSTTTPSTSSCRPTSLARDKPYQASATSATSTEVLGPTDACVTSYDRSPEEPATRAGERLSSPKPVGQTPVKNESEDFFRDCSSNLHVALRTINPNGKDWVDMGRDSLHTGTMLANPDQALPRKPRPLTIIGYVGASYLALPTTLNSGPSSWSITLVISESTFQDLFQLINTCSRSKARVRKDGQANFFVPFRLVDGRYEIKLRAKVSYFEALRVADIRADLIAARKAMYRLTVPSHRKDTESRELYDPQQSGPRPVEECSSSSDEEECSSSSDEDDSDGADNLGCPPIDAKDWGRSPFPNIFDSTRVLSRNSEFTLTSHTDIVPRSLVAARCFVQFWDFGVDGKQKTGYSLLLESLHLLNYSSEHRSDLHPKSVKKRAQHVGGASVSGPRPAKRRVVVESAPQRATTYEDL